VWDVTLTGWRHPKKGLILRVKGAV
jgi:hypothetical protein